MTRRVIGLGHGAWTAPAAPSDGGGSGIVAGFTYPGSPIESFQENSVNTTQLVWNQEISGTTVPAMTEGLTFLWWSIPTAAQAGYWTGLFHAAYSTNFGGTSGESPDAATLRFFGMHPYPVNGATQNAWEISANGDLYLNEELEETTITEFNRKYVHVGFATPSGGSVTPRFYYDYGNASSPGHYIEHSPDSKNDPDASDRCILQGDAIWNRGNERWNGHLAMPDVYVGTPLTLSEVDQALDDPFASAVVSRLWFTNRYPTSNLDISDKSGNGNDPAWVIGASASTPTLYQEGV